MTTPSPTVLDPNRHVGPVLPPTVCLRLDDRRFHELKLWPTAFDDISSGDMRVNIRRNDRDFGAGDLIAFHEWEPAALVFTGRVVYREVTHVLTGGYGLREFYALLSLGVVDHALKARLSAQLARWSH